MSYHQPGQPLPDPWAKRQQTGQWQAHESYESRSVYGLVVAFTILGYVVSCLFCFAAIWQINKAEQTGYDMYGWRIANWIGLALGVVSTIIFMIWLIAAIL